MPGTTIGEAKPRVGARRCRYSLRNALSGGESNAQEIQLHQKSVLAIL